MTLTVYRRAFIGIVGREVLRFLHQRERFFSALVRPLVWLLIFAAGFRAVLGLSMQAPYKTYVEYDVYIVPGLIAMIQLFNGMQSSLSMVYDREMGSMRVLLTTPLPRWFILFSKLFAGALVSVIQAYAFLAVAYLFGIKNPPLGYLTILPVMILTGLMLGSLGMMLSSTIRQLENFAGVMNFIIFPTFFMSSALYPLWKMRESSYIVWQLCTLNPFTYAVEALRFALFLRVEWFSLGIVTGTLVIFMAGAVYGYNPSRGFTVRKSGGGGE